MAKIKKVNEMNESFNIITEPVEGKDYSINKFKMGDLPSDVKFINCKKEYFENGDETIVKFYTYNKYKPKDSAGIMFNGDNYKCEMASERYEFGYVVFKNDVPVFIVSIYEPGNFQISERGIITFSGHEEVVTLWLEDGYSETLHTR